MSATHQTVLHLKVLRLLLTIIGNIINIAGWC